MISAGSDESLDVIDRSEIEEYLEDNRIDDDFYGDFINIYSRESKFDSQVLVGFTISDWVIIVAPYVEDIDDCKMVTTDLNAIKKYLPRLKSLLLPHLREDKLSSMLKDSPYDTVIKDPIVYPKVRGLKLSACERWVIPSTLGDRMDREEEYEIDGPIIVLSIGVYNPPPIYGPRGGSIPLDKAKIIDLPIKVKKETHYSITFAFVDKWRSREFLAICSKSFLANFETRQERRSRNLIDVLGGLK